MEINKYTAKMFVFLFMILMTSFVKAQIINIDTVIVAKVVSEINYEELGNHKLGPSISIIMSIINNTDTMIILQPSKSSFFLKFSCNGKNYLKEASTLFSLVVFKEKEELCIKKGETYTLGFSTLFFLGTDIMIREEKNIYDYSLEILQALPTLKIIYEDSNIKLSSCGIDNVEIKNYSYIPK